MSTAIYRKESVKKVSSPEELNDYIKVANPGVWLIIAAVLLLVSALLVWGIFGSLETAVTASGVAKDGQVVCYMSGSGVISVGDKVTCQDKEAVVTAVEATPVTAEKAELRARDAGADDYTVYCMGLSEWNYLVTIDAPGCADGLTSIRIVTDSVSPISFLLG